MGVSAAMFKWGAGPRDHTRNVQGLVMLYNIKTTYTLHGACACNPETVLWSRAGWRRACEPVSVGSKARTPAKLHPEATSTVSLYTAQHPTLLRRDADGGDGLGNALWVLAAQTAHEKPISQSAGAQRL